MLSNNIKPGFLRADGRKGIRNVLLIVYLVECAKHVSQEIAYHFKRRDVQLIGFSGCFPNSYADRMMNALCTHDNVGAVLLVSLGCEGFNRKRLEENIVKSGRPVHSITIQHSGGTRKSIEEGVCWIKKVLHELENVPRVNISIKELIVGTVCGGSDATSGITANPAVGKALDRLVQQEGTGIFEETGEMIGLENIIAARAETPHLGIILKKAVEKAATYYASIGHGSFAPGNADGGLSTIEEKSMGAYSKSGSSPISGLIKPGDRPVKGGLYLLDIVPDGEPKFGFPNINDNSEIVELIACGAHLILFTTGRGSVVGSAISPVIKICANPDTYKMMAEDMDINAGKILTGTSSINEMGDKIFNKMLTIAKGAPTCSELLGHQEFVLTYKSFDPVGPACLQG